jgi:hypothetical protein
MLDTMTTKAKSFSWSYSKLKNYETCPRRYYEIDVAKNIEQPRSEALERGDELHEAMKNRVVGSTPLPAHFIYMEPWAEKLTRVLHPYQIIQCELKLAMNREGKPTGYFDKSTWFRGKIDYFRLMPIPGSSPGTSDDFGHLVDYKTGRPSKFQDNTQLMLNAWQVFQHYKTVQKLRVDYLWTEYNDTSHEMYTREEIPGHMINLLPRVSAMEAAHKANNFPPKPCGLCEQYCDVISCEFHGKRPKR